MKSDVIETMKRHGEIKMETAPLRGAKRLLAELMKVFSPML
ncbi:MAG: hypothetical protein ACI4NM_11265 [Bullifex sp.]